MNGLPLKTEMSLKEGRKWQRKVENRWRIFAAPLDPITPSPCRLASGRPCPACVELTAFDALDESFDKNKDLAEDRKVLVKKVNERHDPFSHYLPFELVSEIFMIYYEDSGYEDLVQSRTTPITHTTSPLLLASVCMTWRSIAFNTPSLWSSLLISYHPFLYSQSNIVARWLGRAGPRPLSIRMTFPGTYGHAKHSRRSMTPFFVTVRRFSDRWKFLNLHMPSKLCKTFLAKSPLEAPLLETLQLDITDVKYVDDSLVVMLRTPSLQRLDMWRLWLATIEIDWLNLTSIQNTRPSVDEIFELLAYAPRLLECGFADICDDSFIYPIPEHLTHPSIQSLRLYPKDLMEDDVMSIFFERLTFPSLQKLAYNFNRSLLHLDIDIFSDFLIRSGRGITYLSLENIEFHCIPPSSVISILELLPSLTELYLKCWEPDGPGIALPTMFFRHLEFCSRPDHAAGTLLPGNFLPNLQVLVYRGLKPTRLAWKDLDSVLLYLARIVEYPVIYGYPSRPLRSLQFTLVNDTPSDDVVIASSEAFRLLLRMKDGGINLKITEERVGAGGRVEELDLLQHFVATRFSELEDFPVHWFNDI